MYNYEHKITYNHIEVSKQNMQYRNDLLLCFNITTNNFEELTKKQKNLYESIKTNKSIIALLTEFQVNQTLIPAKLNIETCFTLCFSFDFFFIFHQCLKDINDNNTISDLNYENMIYLIKKK